MPEEEINLRISELRGWKRWPDFDYITQEGPVEVWRRGRELKSTEELPNYCHDWNAIHEAVNELSFEQRVEWLEAMNEFTEHRPHTLPARLLDASQREWAEAYIRVADGRKGREGKL